MPPKYRTFDRQGRRIKSYVPTSLPTIQETAEHERENEYISFPPLDENLVCDEGDWALGFPLGQLPQPTRDSFMERDLILFRRKEFAELGHVANPEDPEAGVSFQNVRCSRCTIDWVVAWLNAVILFILGQMFYFGILYDLTAAVAFGVLATMMIVQATLIISILHTHLRSGGGRRHHHLVDSIVYNLLSRRIYKAIENGFSGAAEMLRIWKTQQLAENQRKSVLDENTPLAGQDTLLSKS